MNQPERTLYMVYLSGWKHGATATAYDRRFTEHTEATVRELYARAYGDGLTARGKASAEATRLTGYEPTILRAATTTVLHTCALGNCYCGPLVRPCWVCEQRATGETDGPCAACLPADMAAL